MSEIELGYGHEFEAWSFDPDRFSVLAQPARDERPLSDAAIGQALDEPIDSPPLADIVSPADSVLIVVSDATRATASGQILNLLTRRLAQLGILPSNIAIVFATGIHRPVTSNEKLDLLTPFVAQRIRTIDHNAADATELMHLGTSDRGTPIEVNRALANYKHVIITGSVGFHYFAGFSGGRKSICPGLASARTIAATHLLALDLERGGRRSGVGPGMLQGNAVHEECDYVAQLVNPSFCINSLVDQQGRAVKIFAGHWRAAHARGCADYLQNHSQEIEVRRDVVIVSCGGMPWDINLIQAHKALDMAAYACNKGGTIILLAKCSEGLGRPDFLKWFAAADSQALEARLQESYEVNGQTAWALMTKAESHRIFLVSGLPADQVRRMGMIPARTLTDALKSVALSASGYVLPRGAAFLPIVSH